MRQSPEQFNNEELAQEQYLASLEKQAETFWTEQGLLELQQIISQINSLTEKLNQEQDYQKRQDILNEKENLIDQLEILIEKEDFEYLEKFWPFEYLERQKIKEQYESEIETYREIGLLETLSNGQEGIKDEQGREYPIPTLKEIEQRIKENRDLCEQKFALMQNARIHLVPFALNIEKLAQLHNNQIQEYKDKGIELLDHKGNPVELRADSENVIFWGDLKDDNLEYYPEWGKVDDKIKAKNGMTKQEALEQIGAWKVMIIEDIPITHQKEEPEPVIEKQVVIKGKRKTLLREKPKGYLNVAQQYEFLKQQEEQSFTLEDWLCFSMVHLKETKIVLDYSKYAWCRCLANTIEGRVPVAYWDQGNSQVDLDKDNPNDTISDNGFRPGVILKKQSNS